MIARSYLVPYLLPFPVWRYGPLHRGEGWYADWFGIRAFATEELAREWHQAGMLARFRSASDAQSGVSSVFAPVERQHQ